MWQTLMYRTSLMYSWYLFTWIMVSSDVPIITPWCNEHSPVYSLYYILFPTWIVESLWCAEPAEYSPMYSRYPSVCLTPSNTVLMYLVSPDELNTPGTHICTEWLIQLSEASSNWKSPDFQFIYVMNKIYIFVYVMNKILIQAFFYVDMQYSTSYFILFGG